MGVLAGKSRVTGFAMQNGKTDSQDRGREDANIIQISEEFKYLGTSADRWMIH